MKNHRAGRPFALCEGLCRTDPDVVTALASSSFARRSLLPRITALPTDRDLVPRIAIDRAVDDKIRMARSTAKTAKTRPALRASLARRTSDRCR